MALSREEAKRLLDLADRLAPSIRRAFMDAIAAKASILSLADVEEALRDAIATGNSARLAALLNLNQQAMFPLSEAVRAAYIAGLQSLPVTVTARFGFGSNPLAVAAVEGITGNLITHVTNEQIDATRELVRATVDTGIPVRTMALDIVGRKGADGVRTGGYLGLDVPRANQAAKVAAMLRDPEAIKDYFIGGKPRYTTTDRRYDARVRRAIAEGRALTAEEAEPITRAHRARLLKNRADTIARTESLNALRKGNMDGFRNLVESGSIDENRIVRTWLSTKDLRTRDDHRLMEGQKVRGLQAPFTFPDGTQAMYPGDVSLGASAAETIQCRCVQIVQLRKPDQ